MSVQDCLVLRIQETNARNHKDTDVYVLYDSYAQTYLIRGKRQETKKVKYTPYSLESPYASSVRKLLTTLIPPYYLCTVELYNYTNLPGDKDYITYQSLSDGRNVFNELVAYENYSSSKARNFLTILRDVGNEYSPEYEAEDF